MKLDDLHVTNGRLGFGCVKLTSNFTVTGAIKNLETAFDNGITHFDTARLYGFGLSEKILGKFAKDKRDKLTITTKFGIFPKRSPLQNLFIQNSARLLYNKISGLKNKRIKPAYNFTVPGRFTVKDAAVSLETSLKELDTDYIDYLLLHEPGITDANNEDLIAFLQMQVQKGTVLQYGIGTYQDFIKDDIMSLSPSYSVLQVDSSFPYCTLLPDKVFYNRSLFYFSPYRYFDKIRKMIQGDRQLALQLSEILNMDITRELPYLFLLFQKMNKHGGTTLFTSSSNFKIKDTIATWNKINTSGEDLAEKCDEIRRIVIRGLADTNKN